MRFEISKDELLGIIDKETASVITFEVVGAVPMEEYQRVCVALAEARKPFWRKIADKLPRRK